METFKLFDIVALTVDLPEHDLRRGQVGTIVEILVGGKAFEVEFSDRDGRAFESIGVEPGQMMVLRYERVPVAA
jgi:hypothetical protein